MEEIVKNIVLRSFAIYGSTNVSSILKIIALSVCHSCECRVVLKQSWKKGKGRGGAVGVVHPQCWLG